MIATDGGWWWWRRAVLAGTTARAPPTCASPTARSARWRGWAGCWPRSSATASPPSSATSPGSTSPSTPSPPSPLTPAPSPASRVYGECKKQVIYIECLNWLVGRQDSVPALQPPGWLECAGGAQATEEAVPTNPPLQPPGHQEVLQTHCHRKPSPIEITGLLSHIRGRKGCHEVRNNGKIHQIESIRLIPKYYWQCNSI